jgi:parallel beta-helix repeat protein
MESEKMKFKYILICILMLLALSLTINVTVAKNIEITNNSTTKEINDFFNKGTSIQNKKLVSGDTVIFQKGLYKDISININKRIVIKNHGSVTFSGDNVRNAIIVNTNYVNIEGIIIKHYKSNGIVLNGKNNKITKCILEYTGNGIVINGDNNKITKCKISDNRVAPGTRIIINGKNNEITECMVYGSADGIVIKKNSNLVKHNIIKNNGRYGISIEKSSNNKIQSNQISKVGRYGLDIYYSSSNIIYKNVIKRCNNGMILSNGLRNIITGNTLERNSYNGILMAGFYSINNIIIQNKIRFNDCGLCIFSAIASKSTFSKNIIIQNKIRTRTF